MDTIFSTLAHYCGEEEPFDDRTLLIVEVGPASARSGPEVVSEHP
jgi:hypothetical protein